MSGIPIEDNNKERKNLTLLSFAMIVFYLGGGEMVDSTLRLPLINLQFHCAPALGFLAWGVLVWFTFRYWLETKDESTVSFYRELDGKMYFFDLYGKRIKQNLSLPEGERVIGWQLACKQDGAGKQYLAVNYSTQGQHHDGASVIGSKPIKFKRDWIFIILFAIRLMWVRPSLSANYAPYVMVIIVVICALTQHLPFYPARLFS